MSRPSFYISLLLGCMALPVVAQAQDSSAIPQLPPRVSSPYVRFEIMAPGADSVRVDGSFGSLALAKADRGVWCADTILAPDLYTYIYNVDGIVMPDPRNPYTLRDISQTLSYFIVPDSAESIYAASDTPHGTVSYPWYTTSRGLRRACVYTPAGYETSERSYPVLYLLHGSGGDEEAWTEMGRAAFVLDNLIAAGKAEPMIVVMPNGNPAEQAAPGYTGQGLYVPSGSRSRSNSDSFSPGFKEIVEWTDSAFRTIPSKGSRAVAGLSMGGGQAWKVSLLYPDMFGYVGLFSPAVGWNGTGTKEITDTDWAMMEQQFSDSPEFYGIYIGRDDFLYQLNRQFREGMDSHSLDYTYVETDGGHTWANWRHYLADFLPHLFKNR